MSLWLESTCLQCWHTRVPLCQWVSMFCIVRTGSGWCIGAVWRWQWGRRRKIVCPTSVWSWAGAGWLMERQHRCKVWRSGLVQWSVPQLAGGPLCLQPRLSLLQNTLHLRLAKYAPQSESSGAPCSLIHSRQKWGVKAFETRYKYKTQPGSGCRHWMLSEDALKRHPNCQKIHYQL